MNNEQRRVMNLLPIEQQPEKSSSAKIYLKCCNPICLNPINHIPWNQAAQEGWTYDKQGKPFHDYYCKLCSNSLKTTQQKKNSCR